MVLDFSSCREGIKRCLRLPFKRKEKSERFFFGVFFVSTKKTTCEEVILGPEGICTSVCVCA